MVEYWPMLERGEFFADYQDKLSERELSVTRFVMPVEDQDILGIWPPKYSPEHRGEFEGAVDIAVADPREKKTYVYAPADGIVVCGVLTNVRWGSKREDRNFLNWVHIRTDNGEFYELAHICPIAERILNVGDLVKKGERIAIAGLNGRMTETDGGVDSHIHMFVGRGNVYNYRGLRINWE